jgi:hypothetical protein
MAMTKAMPADLGVIGFSIGNGSSLVICTGILPPAIQVRRCKSVPAVAGSSRLRHGKLSKTGQTCIFPFEWQEPPVLAVA